MLSAGPHRPEASKEVPKALNAAALQPRSFQESEENLSIDDGNGGKVIPANLQHILPPVQTRFHSFPVVFVVVLESS